MKKFRFMFLLGFFVFIVIPASSQSFGDIIDFDTELKELSDRETVRNMLENKKILILEGTFSSMISNIGSEKNEFSVILEDAEWLGYSEIRSYSVRLRFSGEQWASRFSKDNENGGSVEELIVGTRVIVVAMLIDWNDTLGMAEADVFAMRVIS